MWRCDSLRVAERDRRIGIKFIRYRKLSATGDFQFGGNQNDFYINQPEAVAQAVATRLQLKLGTWFIDLTDGTDWDGRVLGNNTARTRDLELRGRINATPGVTGLGNFQSSFNTNTRAYSVTIDSLETQYGTYQQQQTSYIVPDLAPDVAEPTKPIVNLSVSGTTVTVNWI